MQNDIDSDKLHKVQALRDMINSAEKTIQNAKLMLLQLEGKKKVGRKRKIEGEDEGTIIEGTFDGQLMNGADGKQYPVPANYASKSKLIEGDMLKLTITPEGSFVYKQIGPIERKHVIGIAAQDESGNYYILSDGKSYRILLASITYFRIEPGDEIAATVPRDIDSSWAAVENILQKGKEKDWRIAYTDTVRQEQDKALPNNDWKKDLIENDSAEIKNETSEPTNKEELKTFFDQSILDEWSSDIKELEKEIKSNAENN